MSFCLSASRSSAASATSSTVKPGYARNFLLPRKKAMRANEANKKHFEANRAAIEETNAQARDMAAVDAKLVEGKSVVLIRQASNVGALYGSVSSRDIADALAGESGGKVTKAMVALDKPIKSLGITEVRIVLHPEVTTTVKVNVARSPDEAELQAQGVNVMADQFERDEAGFTEDFDPNAEPGATADAAQPTAHVETAEA